MLNTRMSPKKGKRQLSRLRALQTLYMTRRWHPRSTFVTWDVSRSSMSNGTCILNSFQAWEPGQGVRVDYAAIVEILLMQLEGQSDEIQHSTSLRWLADFLNFVPEVMVPFTPRLIGAVLPNLAHHVPMIQASAQRTNKLLNKVIDNLPSPDSESLATAQDKPPSRTTTSPTPGVRPSVSGPISATPLIRDQSAESLPEGAAPIKSRSNTVTSDTTRSLAALDITSSAPVPPVVTIVDPLRSHSPISQLSAQPLPPARPDGNDEPELFDYSATVNALTIQFLSEHEETRVAALKWLIMLHHKAPKQVRTVLLWRVYYLNLLLDRYLQLTTALSRLY
jgi:vacuole morphology and inheritance protein 14